jgi:putative membrane protein
VSAAAVIAGALGLYLFGVRRLGGRGGRWSRWRTASTVAGAACIIAAFVPPLTANDDRFPIHAVQHLLLGMLGPLLIALGAPLSLLLRTSTRDHRRVISRLLRARAVVLLGHPVVAAALVASGMWALYLTPLYSLTLRHSLLHEALHVYAVLTGILFAAVFVGVDPIPRTRFGLRAAALLSALALHAILAKTLYIHGLAGAAVPPSDRQFGAQTLWYGGDLIELGLLVTFFWRWYIHTAPKTGTRSRRPKPGPPSAVRVARSSPSS